MAEELLEAGPRQGLERAVVVAADNELAPVRMRRLWAMRIVSTSGARDEVARVL